MVSAEIHPLLARVILTAPAVESAPRANVSRRAPGQHLERHQVSRPIAVSRAPGLALFLTSGIHRDTRAIGLSPTDTPNSEGYAGSGRSQAASGRLIGLSRGRFAPP
jgi:hypothetical protein